ncbi:MAG TPA: RNA polymerase subunit sigma-24 [Microscillaceae bacterium]|nr:RNA polymerase subunit sigma-24 [Microscillaceae bacterium]
MKFDLKDYQNILFPYAYNILGSIEDAKDTVQDVISNYLTFYQNREIENLKGYLVKGVVNQSINLRKKKSKMVDPQTSLPEPVATETAETNTHLESIASYGMLILLDKLNVKERAVFMLKEAFNYSHQEIAEALGDNKENSRKILSRAKQKLKKMSPTPGKAKNLGGGTYIQKYVNAIRKRDTAGLEELFTQDIVLVADGGSEIRVVRHLTEGKKAVIELLLLVFEKFQQAQSMQITEVNHQPAILYWQEDRLASCHVFSLNDQGEIDHISAIVDPQKLKQIRP